ncbi:natural product biosynthesis luciferase-like monooxygenase domain-containing protein [Streptomyces misionensis]|uniref:Natural product biosynthesis luciferase-like monooxygenase domain-containing protein n=1 Tax=Streptomyces misionensis TaxID=67331 RepID=A0A1H4IAT2_9ACTN|nr:MupA/Atu3671 family FMN-dependent luciferase-like monooxygenase [Streptomyces misionensis]SEB31025.1 natural product biosynthesis luciferase-like monooxygenase domain-containing protein [Streptomyces misionensis]
MTDTPDGLDFGLFFFAAVGDAAADAYRLLLAGARRADELGFSFVSTPERHFHRFGGAFPNPAVTSAAVAAVTERMQIRVGSVVTPLHHPARVVEDFGVIDVISGGRAAISVGSGWNVNDFVLAPEAYEGRRERVVADIAAIRRAWADGTWTGPNPHGEEVTVDLYPRPVQRELPIWTTVSRSEETFRTAGRLGTNVLTHLENQDVDGLAEKITVYRKARAQAGFDQGRVTVMMHTYVAATTEAAHAVAAPALREYLLTAIDLEARAVRAGGSMSGGRRGRDFMGRDDARSRLAEFGVNRYLGGTSLIGSVDACTAVAERVRAAGADEIACLVDFVGDTDAVLAGLEHLDTVRRRVAAPRD